MTTKSFDGNHVDVAKRTAIEKWVHDLINHPVSLAFTSKLNSPCRMTVDREMAAFSAVDRLERGEEVEYEVIRL
jgi:hypothetical protein